MKLHQFEKTPTLRSVLLVVVLLMGTLAFQSHLAAMPPTQDTVRLVGTVTNFKKEPIKNAVVIAESLEHLNYKRKTTTSGSGQWALAFHELGIWRISVKAEGYLPAQQTIVTARNMRVVKKTANFRYTQDIGHSKRTSYAIVYTKIDKGLKDLPEKITMSEFQDTPLQFVLKKEDSLKLKEAKKAIYRKDWNKAIQLLMDFRHQVPDGGETPGAIYWLAYCLNKKSRESNDKKAVEHLKAAIDHLNHLVANFPDSQWEDDAKIFRVDIAQKLLKRGLDSYKKYILEGVKTTRPDEIELKLAALDALIAIDLKKASGILTSIVTDHEDPMVRKQALMIISRAPGKKTEKILRQTAENDPDETVRAEAAFLLKQLQNP
jgi:hypothetical protein